MMIILLSLAGILIIISLILASICYAVGDRSILLLFLWLFLVGIAVIAYGYLVDIEEAMLLLPVGLVGLLLIVISYGAGESRAGGSA